MCYVVLRSGETLSINDAITLIMNIRRCLLGGSLVPPLKRICAEGTCPSIRLSWLLWTSTVVKSKLLSTVLRPRSNLFTSQLLLPALFSAWTWLSRKLTPSYRVLVVHFIMLFFTGASCCSLGSLLVKLLQPTQSSHPKNNANTTTSDQATRAVPVTKFYEESFLVFWTMLPSLPRFKDLRCPEGQKHEKRRKTKTIAVTLPPFPSGRHLQSSFFQRVVATLSDTPGEQQLLRWRQLLWQHGVCRDA